MATGYGQLTVQGKHWLAHKYAYVVTHGEIDRGSGSGYQEIDHTCHNEDVSCSGGPTCRHRLCVNPVHLVLKEAKKNAEAALKPRKKGKFKEECPQGHKYDEQNTMWTTRVRKGKKINERQCKACNRERVYLAKNGTSRPAPADVSLSRAGCDTCRRGHKYTPENTKYDSTTGKRRCRECERINAQKGNERRKQKKILGESVG